mgnify:CR=1 FL=1
MSDLQQKICVGFPVESHSTLIAVIGLVTGPLAYESTLVWQYKGLNEDDGLILVGSAFLTTLTVLDVYSKSTCRICREGVRHVLTA